MKIVLIMEGGNLRKNEILTEWNEFSTSINKFIKESKK